MTTSKYVQMSSWDLYRFFITTFIFAHANSCCSPLICAQGHIWWLQKAGALELGPYNMVNLSIFLYTLGS